MLTNDLVPCFVQSFKTDSKTGYEKALLVGVFDKTTTDLDCCISSSSRDTGKTRQPVAVVMCKDGRLQEVNVRRVVIDGSDECSICKNDRGYRVGDKIVFDVVTNEGYAVGEAARHPLNGEVYRIDYILDDFEGLAQKYVALAISKED